MTKAKRRKEYRLDTHMTLWQRNKRDKWLLLIFLPGILNVLIFKYGPMAGLVMAFQNYKPLLGFAGSEWVGLDNFKRLFTSDPNLLKVLWNTITLNIESLIVTFPIPILFAILLNECRGKKFKRVTQTVTYLPHFITAVIVAGMAKEFLSPSTGFIAKAIGQILGTETPPMLLTNPAASHTILICISVWQGFGWGTIVYLSSLSSIDPQLYEAATIDGASRFQRILHITLPALAPVISIQLIMAVGGLMSGGGFDYPYLLQNGLNMSTMETLSTLIYKQGIASYAAQYSYTTAVGLLQSVANLILIVAANAVSRKVSETSFF